MSVLPKADSKTQLKWINKRNRTQKQCEKIITDNKDGIAFITDFSSPADYNPRPQALTIRPEKLEKKSRRLSYTSENWIG